MKDIFQTHIQFEGASSVERATEPSEEVTEVFSIASSVDSKTTAARTGRSRLKERVKISRSERRTEKAREKAQNAKRPASRTTRAAADSNTLAQFLPAQTLARPGVANDAANVSAITAGVGVEPLLNSTSLILRQVPKQAKYHGTHRRWPQFHQNFKLSVKTQKLHEDQFQMALVDFLEGPPANTWRRLCSDCEETSSPLTLDEVSEQLEVRGCRLPEDHYHQMLGNFPLFSRLILHDVQNKKQCFWNVVEEADHSGEKFSNGEQKNLIFHKIPSEPAAPLRNKQSTKKGQDPVGGGGRL